MWHLLLKVSLLTHREEPPPSEGGIEFYGTPTETITFYGDDEPIDFYNED